MRIAKSTVVFLVFVLMLSVLVANVANLINVNSPATVDKPLNNGPETTSPLWTEPRKYEIGDSADNLMWFLQISDIHISIFREPSRITELKEFCHLTVSTLSPSVVIASGDLTDSKTKDGMGSRQILSEWQHYKEVLDESKVTKKTIWLDVRGNHDNFNVLHINATDNFYSKYSIQGKKHPRSYMRQITVGSEKYSFIAIDACLEPGPRRPFNFVGALDADEVAKIH